MPERTEKELRALLKALPILETDASLREHLVSYYTEPGSMNQMHDNISMKKAIDLAMKVNRVKVRVQANEEYLIVKSRTSYSDDGVAIWRVAEKRFNLYSWYIQLD